MSSRRRRSVVLGAVDRVAGAAIGLAGGTLVGVLVGDAIGTALAPWWALPVVWSTWFGCCAGVFAAVLFGLRGAPAWLRVRGAGPRGAVRHGWVDVVVRAGLGVFLGAFAGAGAGYAVHRWVDAIGSGERAGEWDAVAPCVLGMYAGAIAGLVWFAANLPWLPGRRSPRAAEPRRG